MDWITTNIRLPKDDYLDYKMQAAREGKSVGEVIREKLKASSTYTKNDDIFSVLDELGEEFAQQNPRFDSTKAIRDMRYEL